MKKQYAEAIRYGIRLANETKFGEPDDTFYEKRSEANWAYYPESTTLNKLTKAAFNRTHTKIKQRYRDTHTDEEWETTWESHERLWRIYTESRQEREIRLLREEVVHFREIVKEHLGD